MKKTCLLISVSMSYNVTQAMHLRVLEDPNAERIRNEFIAENPVTTFLVVCCPLYTFCGLGFMAWALENAPTPSEVKAKTAQCITSCCKRMKPLPGEFIEAHDNGLANALLGKPPKQIKME
jgi:hypothetical protein